MNHKNKLVPLAVFLSVSVLVLALTYYWGISAKGLLVGVVAIALYGVLIAAFLLRFGLIFLGVFAVYKILQERHNRQLSAQSHAL